MINFDDIIKDSKKEHNSNLSQVLAHPFKILIIGSSGFGKTNALLIECVINQIYQLLINKHKDVNWKDYNDSKYFTDYSNNIDDNYEKYWKIQW